MGICSKTLREQGKPYPRTCAVHGLGPCESARCPKCGYTAEDAAIHLDHHLCSGVIPHAPDCNLGDIPQEWIRKYVASLIEMAAQFDENSAMRITCMARADYALDLVKAFRESTDGKPQR